MKLIKRTEVVFKLNQFIGLRVKNNEEILDIHSHNMDDYFYFRSKRH